VSRLRNLILFYQVGNSLECDSISHYDVLPFESNGCVWFRYHGGLRQRYSQGDTVSITPKPYIANNTIALLYSRLCRLI
jgi:hypothetical protein